MTKLIIGIDVSKFTLDLCYLFGEDLKTKSYDNNEDGFKDIVRTIKGYKSKEMTICIEATGKYSQSITYYPYDKGYNVSVINPRKIKAFKDTKFSRNKTDSYDAFAIAEYGKLHEPFKWHPISNDRKELSDLYRCLEQHKASLNSGVEEKKRKRIRIYVKRY